MSLNFLHARYVELLAIRRQQSNSRLLLLYLQYFSYLKLSYIQVASYAPIVYAFMYTVPMQCM